MRTDRTCPKCRGKRFFVTRKATMQHPDYNDEVVPLSFAAEVITQQGARALFPKKDRFEAHIEAWICDTCGFSELYASDLAVIREMVEQGASSIRVIDESHPSDGAFR